MKRRQALRSILSLPAITALPAIAQQSATDKSKPSATEKAPPEIKPGPVEEIPKLALTSADAVAPPLPNFFSELALGNLKRLAEVLVPSHGGKPGSKEAGVAEFLDFLIRESPADRQSLYRRGLDQLEAHSRKQYQKSFVDLNTVETDTILAPLRAPWTFQGPSDELTRFLVSAKEDILRATVNSREWAASNTGRRGTAMGIYWYSPE